MDLTRLLRHLWIGRPEVRRLFPEASLERITRAIAASEKAHHGEIRFAVEASLEWRPLFQGVTAKERAVQVFSELRVWDTEANSGVLIYLLVADRDVEILADRGVHAKVGAAGWEAICGMMETEFRQGRFESGVALGIREVSRHLEAHFPRTGPDVNELPDRPALL
ncbi:MAG TPA: TPM domain-containing protein [Fibrobacteria bacterium]|nr:TPM domain-containing protein [Fibrobacteria bacterium]